MPEYDPLTVFASLFAALVHDLDHSGLTNSILVDRKAHLAEIYNFKSPLEQNSIDLAWEILLQEQFADLQACIFSTASERKLFRQVLVNLVLGTDIFGPLDQTNRWEKAFLRVHNQSSDADESVVLASNRKKTIILELLMQASDIAHTMQHFQVYSKWNANLFEETYAAYKSGSCTKDPTNGWYKGELWFFDNIVIPLAKRLLDCGAFGHAANDCLENAFSNRNQWKQCGEQLVLDMLEPRRL